MIKYFNQRNRMNVMKLGLLIETLDDMITSLHLPPDLSKRVKSSKTNLEKVFNEVIRGVDRGQQASLLKAVNHYEVEIIQNKPFKKNVERHNEDALYDICDVAMNNCIDCNFDKQKIQDCKLRKALSYLAIPVFEENPKEGECAYCVDMNYIKELNKID